MPFAPQTEDSIPLHILEEDTLAEWTAAQPEFVRAWLRTRPFKPGRGAVRVLPDADGGTHAAIAGAGTAAERARTVLPLGDVGGKLPEGTYRLASGLAGDEAELFALSWLLGAYRFGRYKDTPPQKAGLICPDGIDPQRLEALEAGATLTRDLINTPASDMGPAELEAVFRDLAGAFGAEVDVTRGDALITANYPMIHAVGRAAAAEPRLLDLRWGATDAPTVTLVGKGVCFDTGGLNIKPGSSMALMKKDMGGAATVMGIARMVMSLKLPVRLRVLVPAVENAISGSSFRPGDVLTSRKGLTVEINNTDAEGRLVLADALALADEEGPDLLICMATLTGAARVALGPDLPPVFTDSDALASELAASAARVADPLWRMPFWDPYESMIEPDIADLDNAPSGGFAGALTAALFLRRFVETSREFAHLDIFGWTPSARPGRPKGAAFQGARAILDVIERRYGR